MKNQDIAEQHSCTKNIYMRKRKHFEDIVVHMRTNTYKHIIIFQNTFSFFSLFFFIKLNSEK
jgi:hypothetical protein